MRFTSAATSPQTFPDPDLRRGAASDRKPPSSPLRHRLHSVNPLSTDRRCRRADGSTGERDPDRRFDRPRYYDSDLIHIYSLLILQ
jgi:hypothetical protein